ncbi:hypothetical protein PORY_002247 [Pneumocystis oryctolagi]|uniref:Uncharacterized protein n=1 Tax=Pneumocystis oryctolagi TaxID=42067 RepID=A0ACB7CCP5_9ASCO|nr:hypothetical protein PORY_002247 [Pneumocystis oryctolagi]
MPSMESTLKIISLVPQDFEQGMMDPELDISLDESVMRTIGTQTEELGGQRVSIVSISFICGHLPVVG